MSRRALFLLAAAAALAVLAGALLWRRDPGTSRDAAAALAGVSPEARVATTAPAQNLTGLIEAALARLRSGAHDPATLAELREALLAADPQAAMAAIEDFLRAGKDAATGEPFAVGAGGLASASTLRVFLMDLLGQLARRTGSGAADQFARAVLEGKSSPEEWAVSLRNVAWSEPNATGYLGAKMREMLAEPAWTSAPSAGLLEAFDVIVYAGDATFLDPLAGLAQGDSGPMKRAALVAMDRLSERAPLAVMEYLNANPTLMAERPLLRADYFAKADLAQPAQEVAVETYLGRADVSLPEKTKLVQALASPATFVSDNLLTTAPVPADDTARQQTLARTLQRWSTANRFPELAGVIREVAGRLQD